MVRFACFSTPSHYQRPKKVQDLGGTMDSNSEKKSQDQAIKVFSGSSSTNPKADDNYLSNNSVEQIISPSSHEDCWQSEYLNGNICLDDSKEFLQMTRMKKSQSLGNILDKERGFSCGDVTEDDLIDRGFSFDYSHDKTMKRVNDSFNDNDSAEFYAHENLGMNFHNKHQENDLVESFDLFTDHVHHESLFSIEVLKQFDGEQHADVDEQSADHVADSGCLSSDIPPIFARSRSVTNLRVDTENSTEDAVTHKVMVPRCRSFENLHSLNGGMAEFPNGEEELCSGVTLCRRMGALNSCNMLQTSYLDGKGSPCHVDSGEGHLLLNTNGELIEGQERDGKYWRERLNGDNKSIDGYDSHNYYGLANDGREPEADDVNIEKNLQQETPMPNGEELTSKEFNIKRIEEWISQIDIENGSIVEELAESSGSFSSKEPQMEVVVPTPKPDARSNLGMEVAYNYISSLTATSSSAQMANLGLVAVPFLSAFASLRVLNLSGNAIVRITAGALPRGLHMLNLSKNNIAAIEGLRDLTRLRVLDLSYNRIVRIGHGLASCSSLKELYLAGNKISEVEGLHRLLKLSLLDLRCNKISTAKGLGQLAANYGSLQAINLEGNPAQRNVGDEQLKKYLLSLLPNLVYYNKQTMKASGSKEISDRPTRSVVAHQFDRGMRAEHKLPRRGSHGSGLHKSSSNHVRSSHAGGSSLKQSKSRNAESRHAGLPPLGPKLTNHLPDIGSKPVSLQPSNPIRRSRSEGTL